MARRACCGATAWISSTITVRVVASMRAARFRAEQDVERLRRRDDDVRRRACASASRSPGGVSPVRTQVRISTSRQALLAAAPRGCRRAAPRGCAGCRSTAPSAARRRRSASRRRAPPSARPCRTSPSIAARNAASVLPEPVGAAISTCRPAWIAGQASACAAVGAAKLRSNQAATAGWNRVSSVMGRTIMSCPADRVASHRALCPVAPSIAPTFNLSPCVRRQTSIGCPIPARMQPMVRLCVGVLCKQPIAMGHTGDC